MGQTLGRCARSFRSRRVPAILVLVIAATGHALPAAAQQASTLSGVDRDAFGATVKEVLGRKPVWDRPTLSFYGTPGLLDMPTGDSMKDGDLSLSVGGFGPNIRAAFTFQFSRRFSGTFRYAVIDNFDSPNNRYDRSFDLRYQLTFEGQYRPGIVVGLRDFGGTGIYSSEFVAATKTFDRLRVTGGLGWGRLAGQGGFTNPLSVFGSQMKTRPSQSRDINSTGQLDTGNWFRGDAALFGGIQYQASRHLVYTLEYSSDAYPRETERTDFKIDSPINAGVTYRFDNGTDLTAALMYGNTLGVMYTYTLNGPDAPYPGGVEPAGPVLLPRDDVKALGWEDVQKYPGWQNALRDRIEKQFRAQGLQLEGFQITGSRSVRVQFSSGRYNAMPEAFGRAARVLANTLPPEIEIMELVPVANGMSLSAMTLRRSDLEHLEFAYDGSWQSYARSRLTDAKNKGLTPAALVPDAYPSTSYGFSTYLSPAYFDPDNPVRIDAGIQFDASYAPAPGFVLSSQLRYPVVGNRDQVTRMSNSVLPHVRSDAPLYSKDSTIKLEHLTAEYFYRPGRNLYGHFTAGYLERMFAGVSNEVLWKPVNSRLALGLELNYVQQRDYDMLFGLRDYKVATGHFSTYYDFGEGFYGEVDMGRYLAGDTGATFRLTREFSNGFRVGAFFTRTNVSFDDFGEGSFDKGITFWIPLSRVSGEPSQSGFGQTIRPLTRDGGAMLEIRNRLYDVVRGYDGPELQDDWGKFWR